MLSRAIKDLLRIGREDSFFIMLCLLIILLFAGASYCVFLGDQLRYWDEEHYLMLAHNLHHGIYSFNGKDPTAFQPPGYPFALFLLSYISDSLVFLRFTNFIILGATICLFYLLVKKEVGTLAAVVGAVIAAVYPLFFYTAGTFYPQILASALFLLALYLILLLKNDESWFKETSLGICLGVLILVVPAFMLYFPLWIAYPWFIKKSHKLRAVLLLCLACTVVVGSWTLRNALVFDRFIPISSNSGINLLLGNSQNADFDSGVNVNLDTFIVKGSKMNEFAQDAYYEEEAIKWIKEHPKVALELYLAKTLNFFNFSNELASKQEQSLVKDFLSFISYYPLLLLALLRIVWIYKYPLRRFEYYLLLFFVASPFLHAIFFTRIRFRIPFDFLTIYFAVCSLQILFSKSKTCQSSFEPKG